MPFAPSAQQHSVPPDVSDDDFGESDSDLETRLTRKPPDCAVFIPTLTIHIAVHRTTERYVHCEIWRYTFRL